MPTVVRTVDARKLNREDDKENCGLLRDQRLNRCLRGKVEYERVLRRHFLDLASGSFFKLRLFGDMDAPPPREDIDYAVRGAVRVFMAAYGNPRKDVP